MDCYSCSVHMTDTVSGINPTEPTYDSIKTQDTSLCWETFPPQADSSIPATGTSGRCETSCYVEAYKYRVSTGPSSNPTTLSTGTSSAAASRRTRRRRRHCPIERSLRRHHHQLPVRLAQWDPLQCPSGVLRHHAPAENPKSAPDPVLHVRDAGREHGPGPRVLHRPQHRQGHRPGDLSFVSCYATETSFTNAANVTTYGMVRGCSKAGFGRF